MTATGRPPISPPLLAGVVEGTGGLIGGTVGCQAQSGFWVFGLEDDISFVGASGSANAFVPFNPAVGSGSQHWLDTLRARVGVTSGNWLFYVTGGAAFTTINTTDSVIGFPAANINYNATGWTVGGGAEMKLCGQWSAKVEYLYIDYGTQHTNYTAINPVYADINSRFSENVFRVGFNYRFW